MNTPFLDGLKQLYHYCELTGLFTRLNNKNIRGKVGSVVGSKHRTGYIFIGVRGKAYAAHRLAWLYVYGEFPVADIDHINMVRDDNRIANLRLCNDSTNRANTTSRRDGFKGVTKHICGKFQAQIKIMGVNKYLGLFDDEIAAAKTYDDAAKQLFGTFARLNFQGATA